MDKSTHLITLENLRSALSNFDMSFSVSNRLFRLAIVSEILDTACLFEQLFDAWSQRLPYGEGPDADVNFEYWKDIYTWKELLGNAQQNLCVDSYPLDLGNGLSSEDIRGNRRKNYIKNLKASLRSAKYGDFQSVTDFAKLIANDKSGMMTFGNMVFNAVRTLHTVLGKIEELLNNPPQELFQNYYEQQRERFTDEIDSAKQKIMGIMHESIAEKRKINRLKEMRDGIVDALRESGFLEDLMTAYTRYDIEDYRNEHNCPDFPENIVLECLVLEDLLTDEKQLDRKKIARHIYEHRKTLSRKTIATFYVYAEVTPEIERLLDVLKDYDTKHDVKEEVDGLEVNTPVENQKPNTSTTPPQTVNQRVAACFEQGVLSAGKPYNRLFCLMAAMIARRMLQDKSVPAFVRMVSASYPALIQDGVTEENYIGAINDLTQKSRYCFSYCITDQKTMIDFIKSCYPTTNKGKERKDSQTMVDKANEIFLFLKVD